MLSWLSSRMVNSNYLSSADRCIQDVQFPPTARQQVGIFFSVYFLISVFIFPRRTLFFAFISSVIHNNLGALSVQNRPKSIPPATSVRFSSLFKLSQESTQYSVYKVLAQ